MLIQADKKALSSRNFCQLGTAFEFSIKALLFLRRILTFLFCFGFVCLTLCLIRLPVFLPPLPEVQCQNFLDVRNPWGKVRGKKHCLRFELFAQQWCKIAVTKKI